MKSRILIVEDGMIEATNFEQLLKSSGYDVVGIASTGEDAITKADILKPDLVLMDIILKGDIDGIDAAEQIKDYLDIPVVYLSTHSEKSTVKRAKLTYPYGYIIKPVNIAELSNTIELALSKHQMEKKLKESEERYRNIVETTNEGVAIESDFKIVFINQRMCDLLGYTEEELLDHNIFELVIDTYEFDFENDYNKLKKGKKFNFTSKLRRKDGYFIFTLTKLSPLYDDQGNYYGNLTMHSDITKQVNAEEALKASEEKYRTLFESLSLGVVYQDQDGFIISANPAAEEILGLTLDQMQGRSSTDPLWRSVHEDMSDFPGETHPSMIALKTGKKIKDTIMGVYNPKKESYTWININATPQFKNNESKPYQVYTTFEDITGRKIAEEALFESENSLAEAQRIGHIGSWVWNVQTGELNWSDELYHIYGLNSETYTLTMESFANFIHPDDREKINNIINQIISEGLSLEFDFRIIRDDGSTRTLKTITGITEYDEDGKPLLVVGSNQDITESKKAEESNQLLAEIVEYSDDAIISKSLEGIILSWNKGAENIYGYSAEEIIGKSIRILSPAEFKTEIKILIDRIKNGDHIRHYETIRLRSDGSKINVSLTLSPIYDINGNLIGISTIARDITRQKRDEQQIKDALKEREMLLKEILILEIKSKHWIMSFS